MVNGHAMYYWLLIMGCIDILLVISGCPSSNIDIITLDRYSWLNYQLPIVINIFLSGVVHFLTNLLCPVRFCYHHSSFCFHLIKKCEIENERHVFSYRFCPFSPLVCKRKQGMCMGKKTSSSGVYAGVSIGGLCDIQTLSKDGLS
jgi:hypothetical protein